MARHEKGLGLSCLKSEASVCNRRSRDGTCRTYVVAQRHYAPQGHDGRPSGLYATTFTSDPGRQNGLYWPSARQESRSPLGDLVAQAAQEGHDSTPSRRPRPLRSSCPLLIGRVTGNR